MSKPPRPSLKFSLPPDRLREMWAMGVALAEEQDRVRKAQGLPPVSAWRDETTAELQA